MDTSVSVPPRLARVLQLIDEANSADPRMEQWKGASHPVEWLYGCRMTACLERLESAPSECLQIAVRAQHMCRWKHPRSEYPEGRAGYLKWRQGLYQFHAECAAEQMRLVGYDEDAVARVRELLSKKRIHEDPEAATVEDAACLVFLEFSFAAFARGHDEAKVVRILQKTWKKMSPRGREAALAIKLEDEARRLLHLALQAA